VTPLLPAGDDLAAALAFYTDQLGFAVSWQTGGMAGIFRGEVGFSLVRNGNRIWADNCSRGIGVADPDRLYQAYRGADAIIGELETKPWGRREFHMIVPSGVCLQFYEAGV
jgi:catechol 2,3-dioxygenase-like lactoylglutathione lyase family enzyme